MWGDWEQVITPTRLLQESSEGLSIYLSAIMAFTSFLNLQPKLEALVSKFDASIFYCHRHSYQQLDYYSSGIGSVFLKRMLLSLQKRTCMCSKKYSWTYPPMSAWHLLETGHPAKILNGISMA